jgi:hypothetical protein
MSTTLIKATSIFSTHTDEQSKQNKYFSEKYFLTAEDAEQASKEFINNINKELQKHNNIVSVKSDVERIEWPARDYVGSLPHTQFRVYFYVEKTGRKITKNNIYAIFNSFETSYFN